MTITAKDNLEMVAGIACIQIFENLTELEMREEMTAIRKAWFIGRDLKAYMEKGE
jgi:predicted chitinase